MRVISKRKGVITIEITDVEMMIINNSLNELLHNNDIIKNEGEFHSRIGSSVDEARVLLHQLNPSGGIS
ncbi:MAG: hypothetical protein IT462_07645 [Planctomycetes bacterium]|nr:hypothetical protein [Planctomycetota bacterium]